MLLFGPLFDCCSQGRVRPKAHHWSDTGRRTPTSLFSRYCFLHFFLFSTKASPRKLGTPPSLLEKTNLHQADGCRQIQRSDITAYSLDRFLAVMSESGTKLTGRWCRSMSVVSVSGKSDPRACPVLNDHRGHARVDCSAMCRASSISIPRYRTMLSSFAWPRRSCTARTLPVLRWIRVAFVRRGECAP